MTRARILRNGYRLLGSRVAILVLLVVAVMALFSFLVPNFFSPNMIVNIARQASVLGVVALGASFVIIAGEIDLSVAAVVALVSVLIGRMAGYGFPLPAIMVVAVCTGLVVGLLNGFLSLRLLVPSFLATLGTMSIARGVALTVAYEPVPIRNRLFGEIFWLTPAGIPMPVLIALILLVLAYVLMNHTRFGLATRAVGSSENASRLAGLDTVGHKYRVFMLGSVFAALGGVLLAGRTNYGIALSATGLELEAIAAVILGGSRLGGGKGSIAGTALGAILLLVIFNGIAAMGLAGAYQLITKGAVIAGVIFLMRR